jgi:dTMP kinase
MSRRRPRGYFIALEGLDGAGTSTQAARIGDELRRQGYAVLLTREPSDGPIGTLIRQALTGRVGLPQGSGPLSHRTLALLFAADRTDHLQARILPALERGDVVLCDRYVISSLAYQGSRLPIRWVETINVAAVPPDLTLFIDVHPKTASRRRGGRGEAPELFEKEAFQRKIARTYAQAIRRHAREHHIVRLDGSESIEEVTRRAMEQISRVLTRRRSLIRVRIES